LITANSTISSYYQTASASTKSNQTQAEGASSSHPSKNTVNISSGAQGLAGIEQDIASRYDVTNLSENERIAMSQELFDNQLISPFQYAVMSFPMEEAVSNFPGYEGHYDPNQKVNYLQQSIDQFDFAKSAGASTQELQTREKLITFLESFKIDSNA